MTDFDIQARTPGGRRISFGIFRRASLAALVRRVYWHEVGDEISELQVIELEENGPERPQEGARERQSDPAPKPAPSASPLRLRGLRLYSDAWR